MKGAAADDPRPLPVYDLSGGVPCPDDARYWADARAILNEANDRFGGRRVALLDRLSRRWLRSRNSPLLSEIDDYAARLDLPGTYFMNLSFEWACTVAIGATADGVRMQRAFDWGPRMLGPTLSVVHRRGKFPYTALTWPIFAGDATVIAPGRFAIALNYAPGAGTRLRRTPGLAIAGGLIHLAQLLRSRAEPAAHLLRRVAETAEDGAAAISLLMASPVCRPAIFCIAATDLRASGIVEKLPDGRARFVAAPAIAANHFTAPGMAPVPDSVERAKAMRTLSEGADIAQWCRAPVMSADTRFAADIRMPSGAFEAVAFLDGRPCAVHRETAGAGAPPHPIRQG
jgi:hypothetical protein